MKGSRARDPRVDPWTAVSPGGGSGASAGSIRTFWLPRRPYLPACAPGDCRDRTRLFAGASKSGNRWPHRASRPVTRPKRRVSINGGERRGGTEHAVAGPAVRPIRDRSSDALRKLGAREWPAEEGGWRRSRVRWREGPTRRGRKRRVGPPGPTLLIRSAAAQSPPAPSCSPSTVSRSDLGRRGGHGRVMRARAADSRQRSHRSRHRARSPAGYRSGSRSRKVEPTPTSDWTSSSPPICSMSPCEIARPSPTPEASAVPSLR